MPRPARDCPSRPRPPAAEGAACGPAPGAPGGRAEAGRRRIRGGIVGAFVSAVLLVAAGGQGVGQESGVPADDGPLRLIPERQAETGGAGQTGLDTDIGRPATDGAAPVPQVDPGAGRAPGPGPVAGREEDREPPAAAAAAADDGGIVVGALDAIDPDAAGILLPGIARFPADLWSGSRRARIEILLRRLPTAARSPAMRRLALALLTAPAEPPAGEGAAGALVLARAERLAAMGERERAIALLERAGPPGGEGVVARLRMDRLLAALDYDDACEQGAAGRPGGGYWRRVRILCQAEAGLIEAATLGIDLLGESDVPRDPPFDDTIYAMAGLAEPAPEGLDEATPLRVAVWRLAQVPIPAEATAMAAPDLLPAIVDAPESSPETRLLAAERAAAAGVLPMEELHALYRGMAFSPDERADALEQRETLQPALARALFFQAIETQTKPALRAELLVAALSDAQAQGVYGSVARTLETLVRTVPPTPEHGWFGGAAGRALLAAGDRDGAADWYTLTRELAPRDAEAAEGALRLWPLMLLSDDAPRLGAGVFDSWLAAEADAGNADGALARAGWLAILGEALDGRIDPEVWDRLLAEERPLTTHSAAPALARALSAAADKGRLGETVLMALVRLGDGGPAAADLATVGSVVASLVSVGLREEARALALEAALAAGL